MAAGRSILSVEHNARAFVLWTRDQTSLLIFGFTLIGSSGFISVGFLSEDVQPCPYAIAEELSVRTHLSLAIGLH